MTPMLCSHVIACAGVLRCVSATLNQYKHSCLPFLPHFSQFKIKGVRSEIVIVSDKTCLRSVPVYPTWKRVEMFFKAFVLFCFLNRMRRAVHIDCGLTTKGSLISYPAVTSPVMINQTTVTMALASPLSQQRKPHHTATPSTPGLPFITPLCS